MTYKERKDKLLSLKKEISRIKALEAKQEKRKNVDLAVGIATSAASLIALQIYKSNPEEIANLITAGALFASSIISYSNYSNYDYAMSYYDSEIEDLKEEIKKTL